MGRKRKIFVQAPNGVIAEVRHRNGKSSMKIIWDKDFSRRRNKSFETVQEFVDSECIRCMKPYTPMKMMLRLDISATVMMQSKQARLTRSMAGIILSAQRP